MPTISQVIQRGQTNNHLDKTHIPMQTEKPRSESLPSENKPSVCETCNGTGFYRVDVPFGHPQFGKAIRCDCKKNEDAERLQRLSGLTESERNIRLDDIDTSRPGTAEMVRQCKNFLAYPFEILTIWGLPGNAKTMALQAVINHSLDAGKHAVYITSFDLIAYIRAAFNQDKKIIDDDSYSRLRRFEEIEILAIDEFDKVRMTEWVQEQVTDLIDRRYRLALNRQAGTLLAMNDDPSLQPSWIYSRLSDGRNQIINNQDSDLRPLIYHPHTGEFIG